MFDGVASIIKVSASMFHFLGENPGCNFALVQSMQNKMAAMRKVAREQVRYKTKKWYNWAGFSGPRELEI
jgi:hypothetical protein